MGKIYYRLACGFGEINFGVLNFSLTRLIHSFSSIQVNKLQALKRLRPYRDRERKHEEIEREYCFCDAHMFIVGKPLLLQCRVARSTLTRRSGYVSKIADRSQAMMSTGMQW